jgi:hypothetical protein
MKLFIHSTFSRNRRLYWPGPNIDTGGEFGVTGVAAPQWAGLARGRTISDTSERKTDSPLNSVAQERFVSDLIPILFGCSQAGDHFEAAESMDGTPAWRIRIQPRRFQCCCTRKIRLRYPKKPAAWRVRRVQRAPPTCLSQTHSARSTRIVQRLSMRTNRSRKHRPAGYRWARMVW